MMPILVKGDDVISGRKVNACHGQLGPAQSQWVNEKQHFLYHLKKPVLKMHNNFSLIPFNLQLFSLFSSILQLVFSQLA